jgi:penicillin-binding protein 1B
MSASRLKLPSRQIVFRTISWSIIIVGLIVVIGGIFAYLDAVKRFEVRRVSLPTRIFTDVAPLRPGMAWTADGLEAKLRRLGYRQTDGIEQPGEYRRDGSELEIFLRGFEHPVGSPEGERVRVTISGGEIETLARAPTGESIGSASLEPELITSMLGDHLENRMPVTLEQVPQHLVDAVLVTEDARFFRHPGVDPFGIVRAVSRNVRARGVAEGGSTLTQQLVKNYYLTGERTMRRKIVEGFMALILDAKYSKREILSAYLNDIYLGRDRSISIMGVGQASQFYFGKPVSEISVAESALIAGMIRSPNNYSPFADPEHARGRRDTVLQRMLDRERITPEQYEEALDEPLPEEPTRTRRQLGSVPYFVGAVVAELREVYGIRDPAGRGLRVYTTVDLDWQEAVTEELEEGLGRLEKNYSRIRGHEGPLQGAIIAADLETGEIRALVGGRNFEESQFNRAISARRQVGSLFKPFVFAAALEPSLSHQNITPATLVNDQKFVLKRRFARDWSPRNYEGSYHGVVTVRQALEKSLNAASVRIGLAAGVDSAVRAAHAFGVDEQLPEVPSLILGSVEIPPIQMAQAYATIGRMGSRIPLHTVRYITDENGRLISQASVDSVQVFPARSTYLLVDMMKGSMIRGTGARARSLGFRKTSAGKTGTTNEQRDAWFIGFTPETIALAWVGFDDNAPMGVSGSAAAVPIWTGVMKKIAANDADSDFPVPAGIVFTRIDMTSGGLATEFCPSDVIINEAFKSGTQPSMPCPRHQPEIPDPALLEFSFPGFEDIFDSEYPGPELEGGIFRDPDGQRPVPEFPDDVTTRDPREPLLRDRQPIPPIDTEQARPREPQPRPREPERAPPVVRPDPREEPERPRPPEEVTPPPAPREGEREPEDPPRISE